MPKIKVLIVDDSLLIQQMFTSILSEAPDIEVLGVASDPLEAREKIKLLNPDVLTLDIEMPLMDGLTFLEKIMTLRPMPVVMVSSLTQRGTDETIRALELGAVDYVGKPVTNQTRDSIAALGEELLAKIRMAARANIARQRAASQLADKVKIAAYTSSSSSKGEPLIAIGASTGGVEALREVFLRLPKNSPPIVVTQHMPASFTASFARRLDGMSEVTVCEAENHARLLPGHAYIAPGGLTHLKIVRLGCELVCKIEEAPPVSGHRPSVDVLFHSVAAAAGDFAVGVILTGMGRDGADGLKAMHDRGAYTIGQNESSCVVYGMPNMAKKLGGVDVELDLLAIPAAILNRCTMLR